MRKSVGEWENGRVFTDKVCRQIHHVRIELEKNLRWNFLTTITTLLLYYSLYVKNLNDFEEEVFGCNRTLLTDIANC